MPSRALLFILVLAAAAWGQKKKKDELTQVLALPKDPPVVAIGDVRKLLFYVSPLSTNGLLSQQTRDAVKGLMKLNNGGQFIHIRAFVAGNGDVRRVPQIISDVLSEKKQPLPAISVIRAGGLSLENAQVVLEAVYAGKKDSGNSEIEFAESGPVTSPEPAAPPRPLLDEALNRLVEKAPAKGTVRVTCFVSTMGGDPQLLVSAVAARFPGAAVNVVMSQRGPYQGLATCQSARRGEKPAIGTLAFTGTRVAFGQQEKDAALAFQRLDRDLSGSGIAPGNVVFTNIYALSGTAEELTRRIRRTTAPLSVIPAEGVAAVEASFAVDAIAAVSN